MTDERLSEIVRRLEAAPLLQPYVTGGGGVVLLNGPFPLSKAHTAAEFVAHAPADVQTLLAALDAVRAVCAASVRYRDAVRAMDGIVAAEAALLAAVAQLEDAR